MQDKEIKRHVFLERQRKKIRKEKRKIFILSFQ